jgi:Mg-chelatase subunit ChlD
MDMMKDPVVMPDGHTYERSAISKALSRNPISPITRQPMTIADARPNYALKSLIQSLNSQSLPSRAVPILSKSSHPVRHVTLSEFTARFKVETNKAHLHIRLTPQITRTRVPVALIAMIDVSGSMNKNACEDIAGLESVELTRLQLVQHALKTIVEILEETDEIVFITFASRATLTLPPTRLTSVGKVSAKEAITAMRASGNTNIWDALRVGLGETKNFNGRGFNISLLLFTDGEPNQNPPLGIIPTLRTVLPQTKRDFTISTFGFGYSIDSELMENIARLGNGIYGYCPDCTMVGTIFINFLAATLTTIAQQTVLKIRKPSGNILQILGISNGSSRNVLFDIPVNEIENTEISLSIPTTGDLFRIEEIERITDEKDELALYDQIYRQKYINIIENNLSTPKIGLKLVKELFREIERMSRKTPFLEGIEIDLVNSHPNHGQISKAFQPEHFQKWGKDFLRSHLRFHIVEQCGNFKDQSLQLYGSSEFSQYRNRGNLIFVDLPPPEPSPSSRNSGSSSPNPNRNQNQNPIHMTNFYDYPGVCFDGNAIVSLLGGQKRVRDLVKGDEVINGGIVECVVETVMNRRCQAVILNGVAFTPFHPIELNNRWIFPCDIGIIIEIEIESWFNLVLEGSKVVVLNGVRAITLGHGMIDGVLAHPYFGTEMVIKALKQYPEYTHGKVKITHQLICERDMNGMIINLF